MNVAQIKYNKILDAFGSLDNYDNWCADNYILEDQYYQELLEDSEADRIISELKSL